MEENFSPVAIDQSYRGISFVLDTSSFPVPVTPAPEPVAVVAASAIGGVVPVLTPGISVSVEGVRDVERWRPLVQSIFPEHEVENALAIGDCESHGNPAAVGDNGNSLGLMQLWSGWFRAGEDPFDPETNLRVAKRVLDTRGRWGGPGGWTCADLRGIR